MLVLGKVKHVIAHGAALGSYLMTFGPVHRHTHRKSNDIQCPKLTISSSFLCLHSTSVLTGSDTHILTDSLSHTHTRRHAHSASVHHSLCKGNHDPVSKLLWLSWQSFPLNIMAYPSPRLGIGTQIIPVCVWVSVYMCLLLMRSFSLSWAGNGAACLLLENPSLNLKRVSLFSFAPLSLSHSLSQIGCKWSIWPCYVTKLMATIKYMVSMYKKNFECNSMEAKEVIFFLFALSIVCIFLVLSHFASKPLYVQWFIFSLNMSVGLAVCFLIAFFFLYTYFCSFNLELKVFSSFCLRHHGAARVLLSSCHHSHMSDRAVSRYFVSSSMWDSACCHMGLSRNMRHCLYTNTIC